MIPTNLLHPHILKKDSLEQKATRDGFGDGLVELGENNSQVAVLCADLAESTRAHLFRERFPDRYVELGVAEQNLAAVGSGMAVYGKIPFILSYAAFSPGRNNEQIRTTISLNNVPVKIVGCHAGLSVGPDGATHQALEDIALMRAQPNMTVIVPCDSEEARKVTIASASYDHPVYIRLARDKSPVFTTKDTPFEIGKSQVFFDVTKRNKNPHVGIIACGAMVYHAVIAAEELFHEGIFVSVLNLSTIKPLDKEGVLSFARDCEAVVSVEEHQVAGGMGSALAELFSQESPKKMKILGVQDRFGQSGNTQELYEEYGLTVSDIKIAVKKMYSKK